MRKKVAFFAFSVFVLALLTSTAQASETAVFELPQPDGCHPIGTKTIVLTDAHRSRDLLVTLWYPAADIKAAPAPYMDKKTADAVAEDWELQSNFANRVGTHARLSAPVPEDGSFPVVLLEHGSNLVPAVYSVLAEGLASSGFIVVATNHPPDSLIAVLPDGHEFRFTPYWPAKADRHTQGVAIGKFAEDVLVADVRFVLDQLQEMNLHDDFWRGHLQLSKIAIVGHSMGGTTAALATKEEPRVLAGVNLDGSTYPGMNADIRPVRLHKPFLFLATPEHASNRSAQVREFVGSASNSYYVVVGGADHMSFTDKRLIVSRFSHQSKPDNRAFEHALAGLELTRSLVEEFLGKYLKGASAPRLDARVKIEKN
jgi:pimeloyl-ACP methyl ester carboxylesterase